MTQTGMCLQRDKVPFGWMTNYHCTVFVTTIPPVVLQQIWLDAQNQQAEQSVLQRGRLLRKHLCSKKLYLSPTISWDATGPHLKCAYRAFSKLAALVRRACDALDADKAASEAAAAAAAAPSAGPAPAPGIEPGKRCSPDAEPPAQRRRHSGPQPRYTYKDSPLLEHSTSVDSASSATTRSDVYDMEQFDFVDRLGEQCYDTFWRGSRLVLKYDERHEGDIVHEVGSSSGLSYLSSCMLHGHGIAGLLRPVAPHLPWGAVME